VTAQTFPGIADDQITHVDRNAFRQGLLTGLADVVHFGRTLAGYQIIDSGRVQVEFAEAAATRATCWSARTASVRRYAAS
jgi:hypothetical protein